MSAVANDNRGLGFRDTALIPETFHVRLMRPAPGELSEIAKWRKGDFALLTARIVATADQTHSLVTRVLAAQPHPEAVKIHEMEEQQGRQGR